MVAKKELEHTEQEVVKLADNMVAGATQMGSMGYDLLISSREELQKRVHEILELTKKYL